MKNLLNIITNIINPKQQRPENCICPEDEYRYWNSYYIAECPIHGHHILEDN